MWTNEWCCSVLTILHEKEEGTDVPHEGIHLHSACISVQACQILNFVSIGLDFMYMSIYKTALRLGRSLKPQQEVWQTCHQIEKMRSVTFSFGRVVATGNSSYLLVVIMYILIIKYKK